MQLRVGGLQLANLGELRVQFVVELLGLHALLVLVGFAILQLYFDQIELLQGVTQFSLEGANLCVLNVDGALLIARLLQYLLEILHLCQLFVALILVYCGRGGTHGN